VSEATIDDADTESDVEPTGEDMLPDEQTGDGSDQGIHTKRSMRLLFVF